MNDRRLERGGVRDLNYSLWNFVIPWVVVRIEDDSDIETSVITIEVNPHYFVNQKIQYVPRSEPDFRHPLLGNDPFRRRGS